MTPVVEATALTKYYGSTRGIEELTFEVPEGEVFGFLGPNGAGKTTTIRTMLDFIRPSSGSVRVFGLDPRTDGLALRARAGYLPGELSLYPRLTGEEYLRTFASLRQGVEWPFVEQLIERLQLDPTRPIKDLSHGNRQKVGLIQAFMHRPDLVVLDEPTQGLDPLMQQTFYSLLEEERARGATTFLSSHVMPEVERVCDRVAIVREGRLVTVADIGELKAHALRRLELHFEGPAPATAFDGLPSVREVQARGDELSLSVEGPLDAVIKRAAAFTVVNIETREPSLEDLFLTFFGADGGAPAPASGDDLPASDGPGLSDGGPPS
ncbi:MAG TPA: ABC transporter ATP-binding protein [Actinomycetota bacterium]|jgi:ABC-2 type transport system ATP-binding protein|nr:ABC transporter ATP-binding protein [Actinomycetota bacterium]